MSVDINQVLDRLRYTSILMEKVSKDPALEFDLVQTHDLTNGMVIHGRVGFLTRAELYTLIGILEEAGYSGYPSRRVVFDIGTVADDTRAARLPPTTIRELYKGVYTEPDNGGEGLNPLSASSKRIDANTEPGRIGNEGGYR